MYGFAEPALLLELLVDDLARVPEHVGGQLAVRVVPHGHPLGRDAGQLGAVLVDPDLQVLGHVAGDGHRDVGAVALVGEVRLELLDRLRRAGLGQPVGHRGEHAEPLVVLELVEHGAVDGDLHGDAVVDEDVAVAVEDPPARGLDGHDPDPVGLGGHLVLVGGHHLQVVEAGEERGEQREHHDAEHRHPHPGRLGDHRYTARARALSVEPVAQRIAAHDERRGDGVQQADDHGDPQQLEPDQVLSQHGAEHAVQDDTDRCSPRSRSRTGIHHAARSTESCRPPTR